ncbi:hypothetical protein PSPO01_07682 [Paraphaeosphaeria sporulosa]
MDEGTRHAIVSADDHGPLLAMTTWFLICTLILCTAIRLGVRFATSSPRTADDLLILAAALIAIGGTVAGSFAVESGFGKRISLLTPATLEKIQKELYATTILYVITIGLSKLSITTFLERLACTSNHKTAVIIMYAVVISWTFAFTTGVLFQCELPRPWAVFNGKCIPMLPFWIVACLVDVLTDIGMIILPIRIISSLQLPSRKKAAIIATFALRTLLILLCITRVILLDRAIHGDWSFDSIPYAITTQAYSTISVLVACLPGLKPFMDSVRTGMLSASLAKRNAGTTFGQDSWGAQPRIASQSTIWGSVSHGRPSFPTGCPAETSISFPGPCGSISLSRPRALIACPAGAPVQVSEGLRRSASHRTVKPSATCPAEASIYLSRALSRSASHDQLRPSATCPAEASLYVSGGLGRSVSQRKPIASPFCPAEASIFFSEGQGRMRLHDRPSAPTACPAEASITFFQNQGRTRARAKPVTPTKPMLHIPTPARQPSPKSRRETPPRPPPPPEELRPDLTCFQPRLLGQNSTVVSCERKDNERHRAKRMGIITQTRQWEVKLEGGCI